MIKAYIAHAMTGRSGEEMHRESAEAKEVLAMFGIKALDPVVAEGIDPTLKSLNPQLEGIEDFRGHWKRDKRMIREAHVFIDLTPNLHSQGVIHELGYARYFLWKPVFRVGADFAPVSVAHFEDDFIVPDLFEAALTIKERFGTMPKRFAWRIRLYARSYLKACWYKLKEWK